MGVTAYAHGEEVHGAMVREHGASISALDRFAGTRALKRKLGVGLLLDFVGHILPKLVAHPRNADVPSRGWGFWCFLMRLYYHTSARVYIP